MTLVVLGAVLHALVQSGWLVLLSLVWLDKVVLLQFVDAVLAQTNTWWRPIKSMTLYLGHSILSTRMVRLLSDSIVLLQLDEVLTVFDVADRILRKVFTTLVTDLLFGAWAVVKGLFTPHNFRRKLMPKLRPRSLSRLKVFRPILSRLLFIRSGWHNSSRRMVLSYKLLVYQLWISISEIWYLASLLYKW